jgi:hypothetical protein
MTAFVCPDLDETRGLQFAGDFSPGHDRFQNLTLGYVKERRPATPEGR